MILDQFITKYNGKYVDFDGKYGCQCTDLIRQYLVDVFGIPPFSIPAVSYAKEMYTKFNPSNKYFTRVYNSLTAVPKKGDIIVWGWSWPTTGYAGHVAIFTGGDVNRFISFSQNYPTGSTCRYVNYTYRGVLGWLRRKT